jgi:DNA-binding NarL/FixJ family response regulator
MLFQENFTYKDNETRTALTLKAPFRDFKRNIRCIIGVSFIKVNTDNVSSLKKVTPKKLDCLYYLVKGYSYREIAERMFLSPRTVEHYIDELYDKFHCTKRVAHRK